MPFALKQSPLYRGMPQLEAPAIVDCKERSEDFDKRLRASGRTTFLGETTWAVKA
jgi:hypothetical protein